MAKHTNTTDARVASTTRRTILGAIASVPVAAAFGAIPAMASNRHGAWLAERNRIQHHVNNAPMSEDEADRWVDQMMPLETSLTNTPAANIEEARTKLRYAAQLQGEGACLGQDDAAELFAELAKWFAAH